MGKFKRKIWSDEELKLLEQEFPYTSTKCLAEKLNRSEKSVYAMAYLKKIHKADEYLETTLKIICRQAASKNTSTQWKKGHKPINKGKRWYEFMSQEGQEKSFQTTFKEGHLPHNTKKDGEISIRIDKRGVKNQFIRISLSKWMPLSHYNWIQVHGPIPKGHCVVYKDRNTMNANIDNLELITQADNCRRNSIMRFPPELRSTIKALGKLKKTIKSI